MPKGHPDLVCETKLRISEFTRAKKILSELLLVSDFPIERSADSFTLDGYFQVIRIYKSNTVYRELFFRDVEDLVFPDKKDEISELLDGLYIQVGKIIE